ncbi:MAG: tetratricopeptide repeat protein, partial [Bacteroidota bacterium]
DKLLKPCDCQLFVPDMSQLDPETLRTFDHYYRFVPDASQQLIVGFPTDLVDRPDERGITWHRSTSTVQFFVGGWKLYPHATHIVLDQNAPAEETVNWHETNIPSPEVQFLQSLDEGNWTEDRVDALLNWMEQTYGRYSFRAVLKAGMNFLEKIDALDAVQRSTLHGLIGSAANFYQFSHLPNPPFDRFLVGEFHKALEHESRPAVRCALLYRIAFAYSERLENQEEAEKWADQAVEAAAHPHLSRLQQNYHLAWACNVRGHVYAFHDRYDDFVKDSALGYEILKSGVAQLEETSNDPFNYWLDDYRMSLFNLAIHQIYTGDETDRYDYSREWFPITEGVVKKMSPMLRFDTFHWIEYYRNKLSLRDALAAAERGIADAFKFKHHQIYIYSFCAADLSYRIGDAAKAVEFFQMAKKHRPVYNDIFKGLSPDWFIAKCHERLGQKDKAAAIYQSLLTLEKDEHLSMKCCLQLAQMEARRSQRETADQYINQAIDLALKQAGPNPLLKVAATAGQCLHWLGDEAGARDAYQRANDLSAGQDAINGHYLLESLVGQLIAFGYDEALAERAIRLIPEAIDEIDSWWNLNELRPFIELYTEGSNKEDQDIQNGLQVFETALAERIDSNRIPSMA